MAVAILQRAHEYAVDGSTFNGRATRQIVKHYHYRTVVSCLAGVFQRGTLDPVIAAGGSDLSGTAPRKNRLAGNVRRSNIRSRGRLNQRVIAGLCR